MDYLSEPSLLPLCPSNILDAFWRTKHCLVLILFLLISSVLMSPNILQTQDFSEFTVEMYFIYIFIIHQKEHGTQHKDT